MERLTRRNEKGIAVLNIKCPEMCEHVTCSIEEGYQCQHQCWRDVLDKLVIYEDADEQGLLLRLPCKVDDVIYTIMYDYERDRNVIMESRIVEVTQNINGWFLSPSSPLLHLDRMILAKSFSLPARPPTRGKNQRRMRPCEEFVWS